MFWPLLGKVLGLTLKVFTIDDLEESLTRAGFTIDYKWVPESRAGCFLVALKDGA